MFEYEKSRLHWDMLQKEKCVILNPWSFIWCVPFLRFCFQFCTTVCSKCLAVWTQWMVCVCHLKIRQCVSNEKTSSILWSVKRDLMAKRHIAKGVSGLAFGVWSFQFCVQFWESRYCFEKRVLTIVKNCNVTNETNHLTMLVIYFQFNRENKQKFFIKISVSKVQSVLHSIHTQLK